MPIWCSTCRCLVSAPCNSHCQHRPEDHRSSFCRRFRSTKGASKARRDHINHEIRSLRALLPISHEDQQRLSYLHSMAAVCTYIRKSVLVQGLTGERSHCSLPYEVFLQALHGFILVATPQGKLVYVSENVAEYLGLSMVDVLQGDTLYDLVESSDIAVVKSNLDLENNSSSDRSFVCCMQTSKAFKLQHGSCSILVTGSFRSFPQPRLFSSSACTTDQPLFVALCTPTVNRVANDDSSLCCSFSSDHELDMSFTHLSDSVFDFLGYSAEEMRGRSWYSLIHPEDLSLSADSHRSLVQAEEGFQAEMVLRLQCKDLSWTWIYIQAKKYSDCPGINCTNFIISETEARFLRTKISSDAFRPSSNSCNSAAQQSPHNSGNKSFKRQRSSNSQSEEPTGTRARREPEKDINFVACTSTQNDRSPVSLCDSAALFTPPYSPASSSSPLQQEELNHDLLMDVHGYTNQLLSSPECSPSYYSYPEAVLTCHHSPPDSAAADQTFDQAAFSVLGTHSTVSSSSSSSSSSSLLSPTCDFQTCTADARVVPDCLSVPDMYEIPIDCVLHQDDFSLLEQPQEGSPVQVQHVPHREFQTLSSLLIPNQCPTSAESDPNNEREQVEISILAHQISSLASSFARHHTLNPLQNVSQSSHPPLLPSKSELILDDSMFDRILNDLDLATRKSNLSSLSTAAYSYQQNIPEDLLPAEQFTLMDAFGLQMGHHDQNTGLHQLNHYIQSGLQQDGHAEETLY